MPDDSDRYQFSQSEITAMRYAYKQILAEQPEMFSDYRSREDLAKSVVESLERLKSTTDRKTSTIFAIIMEEDD